MPELAEVEYYRRQWMPAIGETIKTLHLNRQARVFRDFAATDLSPGRRNHDPQSGTAGAMRSALVGKRMETAYAHGKRMLFGFNGGVWLGIHLGMTGKLSRQKVPYNPGKHDHLILTTLHSALVFNDTRQFGLVTLENAGIKPNGEACLPPGWQQLSPSILDEDGFTRQRLKAILLRHAETPVKTLLLKQAYFPGIGNWMADEVVYQAQIIPYCPAKQIARNSIKTSTLYKACKAVCEGAMNSVAVDYSNPPNHWRWLMPVRWQDGNACPRTGHPLVREKVNGRTTCWSPAYQRWPRELRR